MKYVRLNGRSSVGAQHLNGNNPDRSEVRRETVAEAVERYLAERGLVFDEKPPEPAEPPVAVARVVCENDVRAAIRNGEKIYIGPKTIVTPDARDLGRQHGVLVLTHRS